MQDAKPEVRPRLALAVPGDTRIGSDQVLPQAKSAAAKSFRLWNRTESRQCALVFEACRQISPILRHFGMLGHEPLAMGQGFFAGFHSLRIPSQLPGVESA